MTWVLIVVHWLHVLGGIFWFGGVLFSGVIVAPALMSLQPQIAAGVFATTARRATAVSEVVGSITILLGIVRGTVLGPVKSLDFLFGTAYGITWGVALLLGFGILAVGHFVMGPSTEPMAAAIAAGDRAEMRRRSVPVVVNVIAFFGLFTCMILMRFGL